MKYIFCTLLLFSAVCSAGDTPPSKKMADANKQLVRDFYELAFNQHKPTEAAKKYFGQQYIQHNPNVPNGQEAFTRYFEDYFKKNPHSHAKIFRVLADGNLVALHVNSKADDKDPGRAIVDIFRVEDGKIVEHWDVIQAVPEKTVNGNTMFNTVTDR